MIFSFDHGLFVTVQLGIITVLGTRPLIIKVVLSLMVALSRQKRTRTVRFTPLYRSL